MWQPCIIYTPPESIHRLHGRSKRPLPAFASAGLPSQQLPPQGASIMSVASFLKCGVEA